MQPNQPIAQIMNTVKRTDRMETLGKDIYRQYIFGNLGKDPNTDIWFLPKSLL